MKFPVLDRRRFVGWAGALGALGIRSGSQTALAAPPQDNNVYTRIGLRPIINASGSVTRLGGAPMPEAVLKAFRPKSAIRKK